MSADELDESEEETKAIVEEESETAEREAESEDEVDDEDFAEENPD